MHEKVIVGIRIPIEEDEIVEYIIDGIPDPMLRNQARVSGLRTKSALLEAFAKITLWDRKYSGTRNSESKEKTDGNGNSGKNEQRRTSYSEKKNCFNCGLFW